jgi:type II secretory pathway component PulL
MKTEVYSWRVSPDLKAGLEREARRRKLSVSAVLDLAAEEWLTKSSQGADDDDHQRRLQQAAAECFGIFENDGARSEKVRDSVRQRLRKRHAR